MDTEALSLVSAAGHPPSTLVRTLHLEVLILKTERELAASQKDLPAHSLTG